MQQFLNRLYPLLKDAAENSFSHCLIVVVPHVTKSNLRKEFISAHNSSPQSITEERKQDRNLGAWAATEDMEGSYLTSTSRSKLYQPSNPAAAAAAPAT